MLKYNMNKAEQIEILMEYKEYLVDEITMLLRESRQEPGISIIEIKLRLQSLGISMK